MYQSKTKLDNGLTRYLFNDGSYIDKEDAGETVSISDDMKKIMERRWRDQELRASDWIIPLTDHPQHAAYVTYRKKLRDWPSTADFPNTHPTL